MTDPGAPARGQLPATAPAATAHPAAAAPTAAAPPPPPAARGLWLVPSPPFTGYRSFLTTERIVIYFIIPIGMVLLLGRLDLARAGVLEILDHYLVMFTAMASYSATFELAYVAWAYALPTPPARWKRLLGHALTGVLVTFLAAYLSAWILEAIWGLPGDQLRAQSLRPGFVIGGSVLAVLVVSDERRAQALALERAAAAARVAALRAELAALQARTDPHFLFNSMNAVASLIPDDPAAAETMLVRLAAAFRYALDAGRHATVPLASELSAVRTYLAIEEVRFGARLRWRVVDAPELEATPVPPLCLQPLVENAIRHGASARRGATALEVRAARGAAGRLVITVEDQPADAPDPGDAANLAPAGPANLAPAGAANLAPAGPANVAPAGAAGPGAGSALDNLRARLTLLHGGGAAVTAGPAAPAGWRTTLELPLAAPPHRDS